MGNPLDVPYVPTLEELEAEGDSWKEELQEASPATVGVADHPDPSAAGEGRAATAGADRPVLGPESPAEKLRNALQILALLRWTPEASRRDSDTIELPDAVSFLRSDVARVRELIAEAVTMVEQERSQLKRNLELAWADNRRLAAAIAAPKVMGVTRLETLVEKVERRPTGEPYVNGYRTVDTLVVAMSDGTVRQYWPDEPPGERWRDLESIPRSRSYILGGVR